MTNIVENTVELNETNSFEVTFNYELSVKGREVLFTKGEPAQAAREVTGRIRREDLSDIGIGTYIDTTGKLAAHKSLTQTIRQKGFAPYTGYETKLQSDKLLTFNECFDIQKSRYAEAEKAEAEKAAEIARRSEEAALQAQKDFQIFMADETLRAYKSSGKSFEKESWKMADSDKLSKESYALFQKEAWRREAVDEAVKDAQRRAESALQADREEKVRAQISDWMRSNGSDNQKERLAAGLFDWSEGKQSIKAKLFEAVADIAEYQKLTGKDAPCECEDDEYPCGVDFDVLTDTKASPEAWELKKRLEGLFPDGEIQIRLHTAERAACAGYDDKYSVRVIVTEGLLTFSRDLAV